MGNRTECGLLQLASSLGADYQATRQECQILHAFPFSSERKRMSTLTCQPGARSAIPCLNSHLQAFLPRLRVPSVTPILKQC